MTYKTVLLVLDANYEADLTAAADLCDAADAHLSVLLVKVAAPPRFGDHAGLSVAWLDMQAADFEQLENAVEAVRTALKDVGLSFDVAGEYTEPSRADDLVGERARYADVVLIGTSMDPSLRARAIEGALFYSPCPVLLAPRRRSVTLLPRRILLAWNSSLESKRAAREALDMMKSAEGVNVVLVDPAASRWNGHEPGADVATYLARHGIKVTVDRLPSAERPVDEVLNEHAIDTTADLIVIGAYGHTRLRERIFGGVTKAMIEAPIVPVLMVR
jgi:nucleotide-binding universal stress UspA family protein